MTSTMIEAARPPSIAQRLLPVLGWLPGYRRAWLLPDLLAGLAVWAARQRGPGLHWLSWPVILVLVAAVAATLPTFASRVSWSKH